MKKIKAQPLIAEDFAPFGSFVNILEPSGPSLQGPNHTFYRDQVKYYSDFNLPIGFSPLTVKAQGYVVTAAEYHNRSCEGILPLNDNAILHVAPANGGSYDVSTTKAFIVPKGTIVTLYPGVWHLCPLPQSEPVLNCLIILPERAYVNDFYIVDLDENNKFEIEL